MQPTDTTPDGVPVFDLRPQSRRLRDASVAQADALYAIKGLGANAGAEAAAMLKAFADNAPELLRATGEYAAAQMEMVTSAVSAGDIEQVREALRCVLVLADGGKALCDACKRIEAAVEVINADRDN